MDPRLSNIRIVRQDRAKIYNSINTMRALALFAVIMFHFIMYYNLGFTKYEIYIDFEGKYISIRSLIELADLFIDLLVFVSGFLLSFNLEDTRGNKKISWKEFYKRRFLRVYPAFIFASLLYIIYFYFASDKIFSFDDIVKHMSGFNQLPVFPDHKNWVNTFSIAHQLWFVTFILFCYLLFPLVFKALKKSLWLVLAVTSTLFVLYAFFAEEVLSFLNCLAGVTLNMTLESGWHFSITTLRYFDFVFGMIFGFWLARNKKKGFNFIYNSKTTKISGLVLLLMILLIIYNRVYTYTFLKSIRIWHYFITTITGFIFFLSFFSKHQKINKVFKKSGEISYEMFLTHILVILMFQYVIYNIFFVRFIYPGILLFLVPLIILLTVPMSDFVRIFANYITSKQEWINLMEIFIVSCIMYKCFAFFAFRNLPIPKNLSIFSFSIFVLITVMVNSLVNLKRMIHFTPKYNDGILHLNLL